MWMNGSSSDMSAPAKARRTGKPSPSKPPGAVVTERTARGVVSAAGAASRGRAVTSGTVIAGMSPPTSLTTQLFHRSVGSALCQRLLDVAGPVRGGRAAVVARPRHVAEAERLAVAARLDEPALPRLAARERRDERVDDPLRVEQGDADARQTLACFLADDVRVREA